VNGKIKGGSIVEVRRSGWVVLSTGIPLRSSYRCVGLRLLRRCPCPK